jgi:probable rRNA maturation factor
MNETVTIDLDIQADVPDEVSDVEKFVSLVLEGAGKFMKKPGSVSVVLVTDETIHELNRSFRNVDRPTDVLSFSMLEGDDVLPEMEGVPSVLGDIVVSIPTAIRQAGDYGHSFKREFAFLLVHGFLHIIGYDHQDEEHEQEMFGLQEQILDSLGISRV